MLSFSALRSLRAALSSPRAFRSQPSRRTVLEIEHLEDRLVPSTLPTVEYAVTQDWGSGYQGHFTVRNPIGAAPVVNWKLEFDYSPNLTSIWDGQLVSHVGNHYVVQNAGWNSTIAPGTAVSFGFVASPGGTLTTPTHFVLNGIALDGTTPPPPPALPTVSIGDMSVTEGNSGTSTATFTVTLSAASSSPVTVKYNTANGTATAGSDYLAASGTLTFAAGQTSKTVSVTINGDTTAESDETYLVALTDPSGATIARGQATGTIRNDDVAPPPPPPSGSTTFAVTGDWGSGFTGQVTVRNSGSSAAANWTLGFDFAGQISSIWNANIVSHVGNHYVVTHDGWNSTIAAGGSTSFGFVASPGGGAVVPTNFILNPGSTPPPANRGPTAGNDSSVTSAGVAVSIGVLANDTDPDGDTLSVSSVTQAQHGTVAINADRTVRYTPDAGYTGSDAFTYVVSDGRGGTATGTVSVTINAAPPAPQPTTWPAHVFAPFVDMGLYPTYDLVAAARDQGIKHFNLAFIVADTQNRPSWGGYDEYAVNGGAFDMAARAQIAGVRALGGDVIVSFGGASGRELAQAITDVTALKNAYQTAINAYGLTRIDFDIEGGAVADRASVDRRSQAIAALQRDAAAAGRPLEVWFTLPVLPTGLTHDGVYLLESALRYGVVIGGVNIMAMDYGDSAAPNPQGRMGDYAIQAATSLFNQLRTLYGSGPTDAQLWHMVGVTPMIGLNDVTTEVFDQQEARELLAFAQQKGIGMIAMWSLNRDQQNQAGQIAYVDLKSSSILQQPYEFSHIFGVFTG